MIKMTTQAFPGLCATQFAEKTWVEQKGNEKNYKNYHTKSSTTAFASPRFSS